MGSNPTQVKVFRLKPFTQNKIPVVIHRIPSIFSSPVARENTSENAPIKSQLSKFASKINTENESYGKGSGIFCLSYTAFRNCDSDNFKKSSLWKEPLKYCLKIVVGFLIYLFQSYFVNINVKKQISRTNILCVSSSWTILRIRSDYMNLLCASYPRYKHQG